jgi:hypothetical protein
MATAMFIFMISTEAIMKNITVAIVSPGLTGSMAIMSMTATIWNG